MKLTKYLICIVLLVVCAQTIEAKKAHQQRKSIEEKICGNYALEKPERYLRSVRDVWAKIRESAINSWNYVKSVAEKTKEKINIFIQKLKDQATELKRQFEKKLEELKDKFMNIINDLHGTAEFIKQCAEKEKENIKEILKEIMARMGECIATEINKLTNFSSDIPQPAMNESKFIRELDEKANMCEHDMENVQECLCKIREGIFENFTDLENEILKNHYEARNIADDIKETLTTCSLNNFIDATNLISVEIVEITKCVVEAKGNEAAEPSINNNEII